VADMPLWKFYLITIGILLFGFIIALLVDELEIGKCIRSLFGFMLITVLGFVGSTGSTIISFILPGFFYFKLFRNEAGPLKWCALALAVYGLCVMGFW
jgi:amino acid permease